MFGYINLKVILKQFVLFELYEIKKLLLYGKLFKKSMK